MSCPGFEKTTCSKCGAQSLLPAERIRKLRQSHATFYCPNGHSQYFPGKTAEEKRIEQLEREVAALKRTNDYLRGSRDAWQARAEHEERRRTGYQGYVARIKNEMLAQA